MIIPAVLLILFIAGAAWLLGTNDGARWLLGYISRSASLHFAAEKIDGSFWSGLSVERLNAAWSGGAAEIAKLKIRWQPEMLLLGRIAFDEFLVDCVEIHDNRSKTTGPSTFEWPKPGVVLPHLNIRVRHLKIDNAGYQRIDQKPFVINHLSADLRLSHGTATVREVNLNTPQFQGQGELSAGVSRPFLRLDATIVPSAPIAAFNRVGIHVHVAPVTPGEIGGTVTISGASPTVDRVDIEARLAIKRESIRLTDIRVSRTGRRGEVRGMVEFLFGAAGPAVDARLAFSELDLSKEISFFALIDGKVQINGSIQNYHGSFLIRNKGAGWRSGRIDASFKGTPDSLELTSIKGRWLQGKIDGSVQMSWEKNLFVKSRLVAKGLNPAVISSRWSGAVNMDGKVIIRIPKKKLPDAELSLRLFKSSLRGHALNGEIRGKLKRNNIFLDRFALRSHGLQIFAAGDLVKRLNVSILLSDLSLLMRNARGNASVNGWISRKKKSFTGFINARGGNLVVNGAKASSIELTGAIQDRQDIPFDLMLSVRDGAYNFLRADSIMVKTSGTPENHGLRAELRSGEYALKAEVSAGYDGAAWQGVINGLSGTDPKGRWRLRQPAPVAITRDSFSLSPLLITGAAGERLKFEGSFSNRTSSGFFLLEWQEIDIARANPWLSGFVISGFTTGAINGKIGNYNRLDVDGTASLARAVVRRRVQYGELKAALDKAELSLSWHGGTLEGKLSLLFARYGRIEAGWSVMTPARLPAALKRNTPVTAFVKGRLRESGALSFLFPGVIQESRGEIGLDLKVDGTVTTPRLSGSLAVDKAAGRFPVAGIRVTDISMHAQMDRDRIEIKSFTARSGPGSLTGKATIALHGLSVVHYEGSLEGNKFQALFLPQMRMLTSPRIEFKGAGEKISVRGEARLPELLIYGPPRETPVQPSRDVVIVRRGKKEKTIKKFSADVEIKMVLGERVIVKAEGADAQLGGEVFLTVSSAGPITGKGEITVTKGKYKAYGVSLDITRGRLLFAGGAVENPGLDILAVKTVNEVKAGVAVTGTLNKPLVKLYSEPAMPDADVLSYMVLGHPLGQDKEQGNYLMQAAGALLSAGQSVALQDQVKQRLGLDTIDVEAGSGKVSRSLVTIGKYLSSRLYISYGRALFTGENLFRLRYKFGKRWELKSHSGETSGMDLYYTIQFD